MSGLEVSGSGDSHTTHLTRHDVPDSIRVDAPELNDDDETFPTGFKVHIVLAAWLIVLLRSREGCSVEFEWTYAYAHGSEDGPTARSVRADKVLKDLRSNIQDTATIIFDDLRSERLSHAEVSTNQTKLVVSTGSLSQTSDEADNEVRSFSIWCQWS